MASSTNSKALGNPGTHSQVRRILRSKAMILTAFDATPVLDAVQLLETLKRARKGRVPKTAFKCLLEFTFVVQMVGEMSATFGRHAARDFHGLSDEDFDFLVGCWEQAGRPSSGAKAKVPWEWFPS